MKNIFEQLVILTKFMTRIPIPIKVNYDPKKLNYRGDPKIITGCGQATHIYVFISHRYENKPPFRPTGDGYGW